MRKIFFSLLVIGVVAAVVSGATMAYFSDEETISGNVFAMGTVSIGEIKDEGFPFEIRNIIPGESEGRSSDVLRVEYLGTLLADLYFGLQEEEGDNLKEILQYRIEKMKKVDCCWVSDGWMTDWRDMDGSYDPFENWIQINEDMEDGEWTNFKIHVRTKMPASEDGINWNAYQGKESTVTVILYAVQAGSNYIPGTKPNEH